ncbi:hypothetical protein FDECE_2327 [Fusarium decemcellulare]|nr:hypothetical protein FDECE_2327 [Fusarium decemcellulare]
MQCDLTAEEQARVQHSTMLAVKPQLTEDHWLKHKPFIKTEYLMRDTSLQDLVILLRSRGLHIKKAQLEHKLKTWGFSKNIDRETWQSIDRKINKRKLEGKNSDVIYCGKRLKQSTINKATSRHRETNIFTQLSRRVLDRLRPATTTLQPKPGTTQINHLLSVLAGGLSQAHKTDPDTSISRLTSTIGKTMPEWYPGEHLETAQVLLTGRSSKLMFDCLRIAIYQLVNGMEVAAFYGWVAFRDLFLESGILHLQIDPQLKEQDIVIKAFMEKLFQNEILWLTSKNRTFSRKPWDIVTWLLRSGQDPNFPLGSKYNYSPSNKTTPLREAIRAGSPELVRLLLNFHASIHATQAICGNQPILELLENNGISIPSQLHMIELLLPYFDSINLQHAFLAARRLNNPDLFLKVLQQDFGLITTMKLAASWPSLLCEETVLSLAIEDGGDNMNIVLDYVSSQHRPADYITPDVFIAAAKKGDDDTIRRLHEMHPVGGSCNRRNIKPVHAAIKWDHLSTCQLLLWLYGGVLDSLVYVATGEGRERILRFLIREGADVNAAMVWNDDAPQTTLERLSSTRGRSWSENDLKCAAILIDAGARPAGGEVLAFAQYHMEEPLKAALAAGGNPNEKDSFGSSVLQRSLVTSNSQLRLGTVKALLEAGAALHGGEVVSAIKLGNQNLIALLLHHGGSLSDKDEEGISCLEAAIIAGNDDILQEVFEGMDGHYDGASLCTAVQAGRRALVDRLLINRPKHAKRHLLEGTALGLAAMSGDLDLLRRLLDHIPRSTGLQSALALVPLTYRDKPDNLFEAITIQNHRQWPSRRCVQGSPLAFAALGQDTKGFQELLRNGYRADKLTWSMIARTQSILCMELLAADQQRLDNLAPSTSETIAPLTSAVATRNKELVRSFLNAGADINERVRGQEVQSPLEMAARLGDLEMVSYLLQKGAQIDEMHRFSLQLAIQKHDSFAVSCLLNMENDGNDSPLQIVVGLGDLDTTSRLLEHGADINYYDRLSPRGHSPLQLAVYSGNLDLVSYLLDKGADINAPAAFDRGVTALQLASINGHLGLAKKLLELGARVNARAARQNGRTALEGAAEHGRLDMLEFLLHHGALVAGTGRRQFVRAIELAWKEGHYSTAEWLRRSRNWTREDQAWMRGERFFEDEGCKDCRQYCCDEIHGSEAECVHDFSGAEEEFYAKKCRCKFLESGESD